MWSAPLKAPRTQGPDAFTVCPRPHPNVMHSQGDSAYKKPQPQGTETSKTQGNHHSTARHNPHAHTRRACEPYATNNAQNHAPHRQQVRMTTKCPALAGANAGALSYSHHVASIPYDCLRYPQVVAPTISTPYRPNPPSFVQRKSRQALSPTRDA